MMRGILDQIAASLVSLGMIVRGGFRPATEDGAPAGTRALVLVGNAGNTLWRAFAPHAGEAPHPLDRWTREVIEPLATTVGARALYPFGGPPVWPFQRWARRAEPVHPSPLGLLIHPDFGLWHAYRAALAFDHEIPLPARDDRPSPCESCEARPCLTACPVGAFGEDGLDVTSCRAHLTSSAGERCFDAGCLARAACPVGRTYAYRPPLARFHLAAFARSVGGR